jgi:hypothetical protein
MTVDAGSPIMIGMEGAMHCHVCGEPLGVYESLVAIGDASVRRTSLAREPLIGTSETVVHRACAPAALPSALDSGL